MQQSQINIESLIDQSLPVVLASFENQGRKKELKATPAMECLWVDYTDISGNPVSMPFSNAYQAESFYNSL